MPLRAFDIESFADRPGTAIPPTNWYSSFAAAGLRNPEVHGPASYWLKVEGSFTRALQKQCESSFHVEVQREGFATPTLEEARRLGIPFRQLAWIREVRLCGDGEPWVLARTVIPLACLKGEGRRLLNLGSKPLGAFLFGSRDWQRGPLETGLCTAPSRAGQSEPELARRSLFSNKQSALLVGEYLLPVLYRGN
ncbi:chorismate--pyruvate lyase family protein [Marinobacter sp. DY40_1A1]|uniref:chorismate--pyruvate lyase family protein n=1 Tax=Marinobacter sp. DY40_1A1 TaxID=2583229 RepID=UPI0019059075|nr:chorismate lyase [Marinobacter sp. DY40_1A1]MBK1886405.1 chorismate lyase [Marinobacter sp. DY40_1A1]